ncbi:Hypothetical predicted protein, partial [Paramuricea clavata]
MRKRDRAKKKSFKSKLEDDYIIYKRLRNEVTSAIRKARIHYFKEKLDKTAGNPRACRNLMKIVLPSKRKEKEIEKLIINENEIRDTKEIANCLNSHFTTAASHLKFMNYSEEESSTLNTPEVPPIETKLEPATEMPCFEFYSGIPENGVNLMLKNLKPNKVAGADTIAPKILNKIAADSLSPSITSLINRSLITNLQMNEHLTALNGTNESHQFAYTRNSSTTIALIRVPDSWNVYYNSIADCFVHSETTLYADDSEAHCSHFSVHGAETAMKNDLQNIEQWLKANRMIANIKKTKTMLIGSRPALRKAEAEDIQIHLFNNKIEE